MNKEKSLPVNQVKWIEKYFGRVESGSSATNITAAVVPRVFLYKLLWYLFTEMKLQFPIHFAQTKRGMRNWMYKI
jgi:hypothetical protein